MKTNRRLASVFTLTAIVVTMALGSMAPAADAASMPSFQSLPPISIINKGPARDLAHAAVSVDGLVYVTEAVRSSIAVMTTEGAGARVINGVANPQGIAVNSQGILFVSSTKDKSVVMMDSQGKKLGVLGQGVSEFARPVFVAIDPLNDDVYVTDQNANSIKVYNASGSLLRSIPDSGNLPIAAVVYGDMLYVLDQPREVSGTRPPRIAVFNKNTGTQAASFGEYGINMGQMNRPKSMAVDAAGRLFVVDNYHRVVYCYDAPNRTYLGAIYDMSNNPLNMPVGVAVSNNGKLFVASTGENKVRVFGLDNYTSLSVAPDAFAFTLTNGVSSPLSGTISLSNSGKGSLTYSIKTVTADGADWIQLSGTAGVISADNGTAVETVSIRGTGLQAGVYTGTITVQDVDNAFQPPSVRSERRIPIVLTVSNPELRLSSNAFAFESQPGESSAIRKDVTVTLSGDTTSSITWRASASTGDTGNWLGISPSAQTGNSVVNAAVTVYPAGLPAGVYNGTITFNAPGAAGAPATIQVTLAVKSAGNIIVTTNRQNATFSISGPNGIVLGGGGLTWSQAGQLDGDYTITYGEVAGSITPQAETKTLSGGEALTFSGIYREFSNIVVGSGVSPQGTSKMRSLPGPSKIRIYNSSFGLVNEITPFGPKYISDIPVAVGDVDGDGYDEIIAAYGADASNRARVKIFRRDGTVLAHADFMALDSTFKFGARVAAGDFDGDGQAEIVVGAGPGKYNKAVVRIFKYSNGSIKNTGVYAVPFTSLYGLNVAAGDLDGDGIDELIVGPGPDPAASAAVAIFRVDTSVAGSWALQEESVRYITPFAGVYGANVAAGDLDGDGMDEIIASTGLNALAQDSTFTSFRGDGSAYGLSVTDGAPGGLEICAGDLNEDGRAEIITAFGPSSANPSTVKVYNGGTLLKSFEAFRNTAYGAKVAFGRLGY